jgi:aspartate ammonia-lyase
MPFAGTTSDGRPDVRIERDSIGALQVPAASLFGVQTQRAVDNFQISGVPISRHRDLIRSLAMVKRATAEANRKIGLLPAHLADVIQSACDEIIDGRHYEAFPIDVFQGGAGTSTNMNMNEVIANLSLQQLGYAHGQYDVVNPNDHVNLSQSTNDVYPTAARLSLLLAHEGLAIAIADLATAFEEKGREFAEVLKLGRTQLQDAVPMTLGQELSAFAVTLREDVARLREIVGLFQEVNLGGTAIGTGLNAPAGYANLAVAELSRISGYPMVLAANLVEATWDMGAFVLFSGMLKRLAVKLSKIANDLRLLSSGPRGGFGEIRLPPMQPGSSIMPGKVNPVIPEVVNLVCFQIIGYDTAITFAAEAGQLQLNAFEPLIVHNLHTGISLLGAAARTLKDRCIKGITADVSQCQRHVDQSTALATALTPHLGYVRSAEIAKKALEQGKTIQEVVCEAEGLSPEQVNLLLDPLRMTIRNE